ncbi:MAG: agmatine deiminase family protein [Bacteroidales bacterium]|nr:agmatine deiminase family protein [Bacteroidales bacterium]
MKKTFVFTMALILAFSALAQIEPVNKELRLQSILQTFQQRDVANRKVHADYPVAPAPKDADSPKGGLDLPANNWFPGEWEEVKAIAVTCYYDYLVPGHENDNYWYADPIVSGYADYYHYSGGWQRQGGGPYVASPALNSASYGEFVNVFLYLMDAIQLGGAEAWVRIENASDSTLIKNKLTSMNLRTNKLKWIIGTGNSFWFRDCGPIAFYYGDEDNVGMVDFGYYTGRALDDSLPSLIEEQMGIPNYITMVKWEGGNCLVDGAGMVISSDAIYSGNMSGQGQYTWDGVNPSSIHVTSKPALNQQKVKDSLAHIMGPRGCHIIPAFHYDGGTGHIDLYADMIDENEFVFSQFPEAYSNWVDYKTAAKNIDSLCSWTSVFGNKFKCHYIPFPCTDNGGTFASQTSYNQSYTRTYSNHTFVNNVLIQPVFSTVSNGQPTAQWDRDRFEAVKRAYPGYTVYPINVKSFDGSGGAIHCITKQIPADNPVRILHPSITGNTLMTYANTNAPITAKIHNKSGIASAKVVYRVNGGNWNEAALTPGADDEFSGSIPTTSFTTSGGSNKVEYYISATSNNGKTITKPIPASQGGYYTFYVGSQPVGIENAEQQHFGQFFPNPADGRANVEISLAEGSHYDVTIVDQLGRVAHRSTLDAQGDIVYSIDTHKLASGVYNVVFSNGNERIVRRIVVK